MPQELLAEHGAVSPEVARAMAHGARRGAGCRRRVSVTGVAGPDGGSPEKPVGLVYFHAVAPWGEEALRIEGAADRETVRQRAAKSALHLVRRLLEQNRSEFRMSRRLPWMPMHGCASSSAIRSPSRSGRSSQRWSEETFAGVRGARAVPAANLHLTVAFLGLDRGEARSPTSPRLWGRGTLSGRGSPCGATARPEASGCSSSRISTGAGTALALDVQARLGGARRVPARGASLASARHRGALEGTSDRCANICSCDGDRSVRDCCLPVLSCASAERSTTFSSPPR